MSVCLCAFVIWLQGCGRRDSGHPPHAPREALEKFRIDDRFKIELFASEPLLDGPVAMAIDDKGRIFVFESPVYPLKTSDRSQVKILEDTDGDGKPDRASPSHPMPSCRHSSRTGGKNATA